MTKPSPFRYFKTSPEIIRLAVMLYVRFPLSLRNVEDLLHERGIDVSHETVRFWWNRFGPMFAAEIRQKWKCIGLDCRLPALETIIPIEPGPVMRQYWRLPDLLVQTGLEEVSGTGLPLCRQFPQLDILATGQIAGFGIRRCVLRRSGEQPCGLEAPIPDIDVNGGFVRKAVVPRR